MTRKIVTNSEPNAGRFRKGQTGNPKGRPKGSFRIREISAFSILDERMVKSPHNGVVRNFTSEEALQQEIYEKALRGVPWAMRKVIHWIEKNETWHEKRRRRASTPIPRLVSKDPDNADEALILLGIAIRVHQDEGSRLLLRSTWVQRALSRRRGGARLTSDEMEWIKRGTQEPQKLRWPRGKR